MSYTPVVTAAGQAITDALWNTYIRDNLAASAPDAFTTKGDMFIASGNDAGARLAVGTDFQVLESLASATLGVQHGSGVRSAVWKSGGQAIATATTTIMQIATALSDPFSMLDAVNFRLTIPAGFPTRDYMIVAQGYWTGHATDNTYRHLEIRVNNAILARASASQDVDGEAIGLCASSTTLLAATNYVDVYVKQNSGGNLAFNDCRLSLFMIR